MTLLGGPRSARIRLAAGLLAVLVVVAIAVTLALQAKPPKALAQPKPVATPSPTKATPTPIPSPTPSLPNTFAYISLQPGDCFDSPAFTRTLSLLAKRPCTAPHDAEVTQLATLPSGLSSYPAIVSRALTLCEPIDAAAYRRQSGGTALQYYELYPTLADYQAGRHTVTCALSGGSYQGARKLTAPLAN
ncbi:hypothetical protein [Streptacidiphilus sp. MAP5-3]|uniref:hypothetical protein n=1 Tax=unclassified Streptacidiphilus TaxID=2643834 RepID=UPI00351252BA